MDEPADPADLGALAAMLGREVCRPLDRFEDTLARLLAAPPRPLTAAERQHADLMLQLCAELRALTREALGDAGDGAETPPPSAPG